MDEQEIIEFMEFTEMSEPLEERIIFLMLKIFGAIGDTEAYIREYVIHRKRMGKDLNQIYVELNKMSRNWDKYSWTHYGLARVRILREKVNERVWE